MSCSMSQMQLYLPSRTCLSSCDIAATADAILFSIGLPVASLFRGDCRRMKRVRAQVWGGRWGVGFVGSLVGFAGWDMASRTCMERRLLAPAMASMMSVLYSCTCAHRECTQLHTCTQRMHTI